MALTSFPSTSDASNRLEGSLPGQKPKRVQESQLGVKSAALMAFMSGCLPPIEAHVGSGPFDTTDTATRVFDADKDGYGAEVDCNDHDASIYPGAQEICDGVDNDCDGEVDGKVEETVEGAMPYSPDNDLDGYADEKADPVWACDTPQDPWINWMVTGEPEEMDCNDYDSTIYPGAKDIDGDGVDSDCDGEDD